MFPIPLATSTNEVPLHQFWDSILLYFKRPHLVNRRITGALTALFLKVDFENDNTKRISEVFTRSAILYEVRKLKAITKDLITEDFLKNILETYDKEVYLEQAEIDDIKTSKKDIFVSVRILLSRNQKFENCVEIVILDKKNDVATFFAVCEFDNKALAPPFPYDIEHVTEGNLRICLQDVEHAESASAEWLYEQLFMKLMKWAEDYEGERNDIIQQSLSLISIETYTELYHSLKSKYGKKIVESWKENTNPLKFVYEDISIATYLICLWQKTNPDTKPNFVDLGCGNGLLVYILNEEGYPGCGIDVRKRRIWDWYPSTVTLKVQAITPSAASLFPEADWIIGNHSDELTPWIPIIASRSSYKTNFFLLPCCAYQFNGQKYQRMNTRLSVYTDYLRYVETICSRCKFITKIDKLRIPSTKRTCIVSFGREYQPDELERVDECITALIKDNCEVDSRASIFNWTSDFQARPDVEEVRNCTQLDKNIIASIIEKICQSLLAKQNCIIKADGQPWNKGRGIPLGTLADIIGKDDMKELKNQCRGLRTLIKNHRYIFELVGDLVRLRTCQTFEATTGKYKLKQCWFYKNHPDGCLHSSEICAYQHL